jgi:hypothetical protein
VNSLYTTQTVGDLPEAISTDTATGPWSAKTTFESRARAMSPRSSLRPIWISIVLAFSPLTSVADPWLIERRHQTQPTAHVFMEFVGRRRVSRHEARILALRFMERMEAARLQAAEDEARRAFLLEEGE